MNVKQRDIVWFSNGDERGLEMGQDVQDNRIGEEMGMAAKSTQFVRSQGRKERIV